MPKHKINNTKSNILVAVAITLITISIIGLLSSRRQVGKPYEFNFEGISATKAFQFANASTSGNLNVLSSTTSALEKLISPTKTPTPSPTPETTFHHSKLGFSFDIPKNSTAIETDPGTIILVGNSSGGAFIEIPSKLQIEIAVVQLNGMNIFQYYHNRLATIFDDKILSFQEATKSATLKGYEILLKNEETKQNKTLMFLSFRGSQIFEIEAVYLKPNHKKEEEIVKKLIESLKPY
jgi:hypothetical protein